MQLQVDNSELDDSAKDIAFAAKNKITTSTSFWGKSVISPLEIENKIPELVRGVLMMRANLEPSLSDNKNDTMTIEMGIMK